MSGILGVYHIDGEPVDRKLLQTMMTAAAHRGLDGAAWRTDGPVGLCHLKLQTTPQAADDSQPLVDESNHLILTFNGRLDNRQELSATLQREGCRLLTETDAEIVLRAYGRWGRNSVARFVGDFALAIWDARTQQLFCARDRLGVKPFYYVLKGKSFVFASELRQLLQLPGFAPEPNERMIALYLVDSCENVEETLYHGVHRLPPAGWLRASRRGVKKGAYWQLSPSELLRYRSDAEYSEHFQSLFQEAVRCRMRAAGPVGLFLSGGLDSSAVACVARKIHRATPGIAEHGLETFSLLFEDPAADERRYVEAVVSGDGLTSHLLFPERERIGLDIESTEPHPLGPLYYPNLFMMKGVVQRARDRGIRVLLGGAGGDDLFCGFEYCADLLRHRQWRTLYTEMAAVASLTRTSRRHVLCDWAVRPLLPLSWRQRARTLFPRRVPAWIGSEFTRRTGLDEWMARQRAPSAHDPQDQFPDLARRFAEYRLFGSGCYPFGFEEEDRFFGAASLECRSPFFDVRLVEFAFMLPQPQKCWGGQTRIVVRNSMKGILPEAIRTRSTKADFAPFMDRELRVRQRQYIEPLFLKSRLADAGIVDGRKLAMLWRGYADVGGPRRWDVLTLLNLERWFRYAVCERGVGNEGQSQAS